MARPLATYTFDVVSDAERAEVLESIAAASWEDALLTGKMLKFDKRPRFGQAFRHRVTNSETPVTKTLAHGGSVFVWLEALPDTE
jgi:hypothetical protein